MTRDQLLNALTVDCGLCGCRSTIETTCMLFDLLESAEMRDVGLWQEADQTIEDVLGESNGMGRDMILFWLHATGLVEHGIDMEDFGLTDYGADVLEGLRTYGPEGVWTGEIEEGPGTVTELMGGPDRSLN